VKGEWTRFTAEDVQKRIKETLFTPVRVMTSSGEPYDIYHPDRVLVGKRQMFVGTASANSPTIYDRYSLVSLPHITALENLPVPATLDKNGQ
jgi:hypothetical protein